MKSTFFATAALVLAFAAPAFAQSYDPDTGSGNLGSAPYARNRNNPIHNTQTIPTHRRAVRRAKPSEAYARSPVEKFSAAPAFGNGYRLPGAKYDADGRFIDQNSPGRW